MSAEGDPTAESLQEAIHSRFMGAEERMLAAIADGDAAAFTELYDRLGSTVFGVVRRLIRDEGFAQDVVQEVFTDVWRNASRFDPTAASARSWVMVVAHRRAVDRIRREQASRDRDERTAVRNTTVLGNDQSGDDAVEHLHLEIERRRVKAALVGLTGNQREAIELAYFGGLTHVEVAAYLNVPLGTVKSRIRDGMTQLRHVLGVEQP